MKLVADESVEGPTVAALRKAGHDVVWIAETEPGIDDSNVLRIAREEQSLLIKADKDFGELVFRNGEPHCGILLIRSASEDLFENAVNLVATVDRHGLEMVDRFSVLGGNALRIRRTRGLG